MYFEQALDVWKQNHVTEHLEVAAILNNLAGVLEKQGKFDEALDRYRLALEMKRKLLPDGHPELIPSLGNLARLYARLAKDDEALKLLGQAMEITKRFQDGNNPAAAVTLSTIARIYFKQGRFQEAQEELERSVAIERKVLGKDHPNLAIALANQSFLQEAVGEYDQGIRCLEEALRIMRARFPQGNPQAAQILSHLGDLHRLKGELDRALQRHREALEIWRKFHPDENHPDLAPFLNNLGLVHAERAEYTEAFDLENRALGIVRKSLGKDHPTYADQLNNLAWVYNQQGLYSRAISTLREALEIQTKHFTTQNPTVALTLMSLGTNLDHTGDASDALKYLEQALGIFRRRLGESHPDVAVCLNNLAAVYSHRGDHGKAIAFYQMAATVEVKRIARNHPRVATRLNNMGTAYDHLGNYREAESCHRQALAIREKVFGSRHPQVANSRNNLASVYMLTGRLDEAEAEFTKALEVWRSALGGERNMDVANVYNSLGGIHEKRKELAEALKLYDKGLHIRREILGDERHFEIAQSLNNRASILEKQGKLLDAIKTYDEALNALRIDRDPTRLAFDRLSVNSLRPVQLSVSVLKHRGNAMEKLYGDQASVVQLRECLQNYQLASDMLDNVRDREIETELSKIVLGIPEFSLFSRQIGLFSRIAAREAKSDALSEAFAVAERGLARVLLESIARSRARTIGGVDPSLVEEEQKLQVLRNSYQELVGRELSRPTGKIDHSRVESLEKQRDEVERSLIELAQRMKKQYPRYAMWMSPKICSVAEARACLSENEVALLYLIGDPDSFLVVLSRESEGPSGGIAIHRLPSSDDILNRVARLFPRRNEHEFEWIDEVKALGAEAFDVLLGPASTAIRGKDLVIVPSGFLSRVPFQLLVERADDPLSGPFLIEKHRIRYAPSLSVLHVNRQWDKARPRPSQPFWGIADPIYQADDPRVSPVAKFADSGKSRAASPAETIPRAGSDVQEGYHRLEGSGLEIQALARFFDTKPDFILTGPAATTEHVKAASNSGTLADARFLHFAAHGSLFSASGTQPRLVLSLFGEDSKPIDDGFLDLEEVTQLHLNSDLVVLSACETGSGISYSGEGVLSLARAFLHAGSRGVLCSLWRVNDRSTPDLMVECYKNLKAGRPAADALRSAQLEMIARGQPPRAWAPFILIGE